jgi:hypothetical protein
MTDHGAESGAPGEALIRGAEGGDDVAKKTTGPAAAKAASKVLRNPKSSRADKSAAGSALSQVEKKRR